MDEFSFNSVSGLNISGSVDFKQKFSLPRTTLFQMGDTIVAWKTDLNYRFSRTDLLVRHLHLGKLCGFYYLIIMCTLLCDSITKHDNQFLLPRQFLSTMYTLTKYKQLNENLYLLVKRLSFNKP